MIENAKNAVVKSEEMLRRSDASFKSIFEKNVEDAKKALKDAEDPNSKHYLAYTKNYPQAVKNLKQVMNGPLQAGIQSIHPINCYL